MPLHGLAPVRRLDLLRGGAVCLLVQAEQPVIPLDVAAARRGPPSRAAPRPRAPGPPPRPPSLLLLLVATLSLLHPRAHDLLGAPPFLSLSPANFLPLPDGSRPLLPLVLVPVTLVRLLPPPPLDVVPPLLHGLVHPRRLDTGAVARPRSGAVTHSRREGALLVRDPLRLLPFPGDSGELPGDYPAHGAQHRGRAHRLRGDRAVVFRPERERRGETRDGTRQHRQRSHLGLAHDFVVHRHDARVSAHEGVVHGVGYLVIHALQLAVREPRDVARQTHGPHPAPGV